MAALLAKRAGGLVPGEAAAAAAGGAYAELVRLARTI